MWKHSSTIVSVWKDGSAEDMALVATTCCKPEPWLHAWTDNLMPRDEMQVASSSDCLMDSLVCGVRIIEGLVTEGV